MKPGATTRPSASMTRFAGAGGTIFPPAIATSPRRDGAPVPSTTVPLRIRRSAGMSESYRPTHRLRSYLVFSGVLPDVLPEEPPGDDGEGFFFGCSVELPAEPLGLPDGLLAVPPLPAGRLALSRSQPDKSVPAKASAKTTERIRFMGCDSFRT